MTKLEAIATGVLGSRWNAMKREGWRVVRASDPGPGKRSELQMLGPLPLGKVQQLLERGVMLVRRNPKKPHLSPAFIKAGRAWDHFNHWYRQHGHWVYPSREKALEKWMKDGIDGLPDYPGPVPKVGVNEYRNPKKLTASEQWLLGGDPAKMTPEQLAMKKSMLSYAVRKGFASPKEKKAMSKLLKKINPSKRVLKSAERFPHKWKVYVSRPPKGKRTPDDSTRETWAIFDTEAEARRWAEWAQGHTKSLSGYTPKVTIEAPRGEQNPMRRRRNFATGYTSAHDNWFPGLSVKHPKETVILGPQFPNPNRPKASGARHVTIKDAQGRSAVATIKRVRRGGTQMFTVTQLKFSGGGVLPIGGSGRTVRAAVRATMQMLNRSGGSYSKRNPSGAHHLKELRDRLEVGSHLKPGKTRAWHKGRAAEQFHSALESREVTVPQAHEAGELVRFYRDKKKYDIFKANPGAWGSRRKSGKIDTHDVDELILWIDNNEHLYNRKIAVEELLDRKRGRGAGMRAGHYDTRKAPRAFMPLIRDAIKTYRREVGHEREHDRNFSTTVQRATAVELTRRYASGHRSNKRAGIYQNPSDVAGRLGALKALIGQYERESGEKIALPNPRNPGEEVARLGALKKLIAQYEQESGEKIPVPNPRRRFKLKSRARKNFGTELAAKATISGARKLKAWAIVAYDKHGKKLMKETFRSAAAYAENKAKKLVGKKIRGHRIYKAVLES